MFQGTPTLSADQSNTSEDRNPPVPTLRTYNENPAFKNIKNENESVLNVMITKEKKLQVSTAKRVAKEIASYLGECSSSTIETSLNDPIAWWKARSVFYPMLSHLVKLYLCVPAASVPSERILVVLEIQLHKKGPHYFQIM